jgi:hypothetical protein
MGTSVIGRASVHATGADLVWPEVASAAPEAKVDWLVVLGLKGTTNPNESLFGTHIREAVKIIKNW